MRTAIRTITYICYWSLMIYWSYLIADSVFCFLTYYVGGASVHLVFNRTEQYSEPSQTYKLLTIFAKSFILDVSLSSDCTSVEFEHCSNRNSRSQMFFKIGVLKNFEIFTGKHLCLSLFLINLQALGLQLY